MTAPRPLDLTIVICTYNRPLLLEKALASVAALRQPPQTSLSVVVVDNSDDGNALPFVTAMQGRVPYRLVAIGAHPANISVARNAGIAAASSEIVAFIDDDQCLEPDWLHAVADGLAHYPYDVLFGHVTPLMETPERADAFVRAFFSRHLDAPAGHELFATGARKTRAMPLATNNCIFRRAATLTDPVPFDPAFGNGGGEDFELFCRLQRRGCRFGWLPDAKAFEFVPANRCEPDYLSRRFFAGGQAYANAVAMNSAFPALERWRQRAIALAQSVLLLASLPMRHARGPEARRQLRYHLAGIRGKLSLRQLEPIYLANSPADVQKAG